MLRTSYRPLCTRPAGPLFSLLLLGVVLTARPALSAIDDPWLRAEVGAAYACFAEPEGRHHGLAGTVDGLYGINSAWVIRAGYLVGEHRLGDDDFQVHQLSIAPRYQLDFVAYVPWVELSPALTHTLGDGGPEPWTPSVALGFGFDWLIDPDWSMSVNTHLHQLFGVDRTPGYLTVGVRVGYRWTLGDPFAP